MTPDQRPAPWQVGAVVVAVWLGVVGWFDWVQLGQSRRNSYEMFRSLQRLGLDELDPLRVIWFLVPVVCLGAGLLAVFGRQSLATLGLGVVAIVVSVAAVGVILNDVNGGAGPFLALGGSGAAVVLAVSSVLGRR